MENNLEILERIMKPYFDKKADIENVPVALENEKNETTTKIREMKTERTGKRKELEAELESLKSRREIALKDFKEKMERDIEEYIGNAQNSNSNFFASYGSMLRKDLEREYNIKLKELEDNFKDQEEALVAEIAELKVVTEEEKANKQALEDLGKRSDYSRVDLREMVEIKGNLRKSLIAEQKRLNFELKQQQINFDSTMLRLDSFKYEYNDQQQVINGADWRSIYEESNKIADKMNEIRKALKKVEEYLNITELTKEETAAVMMSMTPWEKEEYDRRKANKDISSHSNNGKDGNESDIIEIEDKKQYSYEEKDGKVVVEDMENLIGVIYNDVVKTISNLDSVKINGSKEKLGNNEYYLSSKTNGKEYEQTGTIKVDESIKLPCGEYVNKKEIAQAAEKLYSKPKAITYIVKETGKAYKMSKDAVKKLKSSLKKCTTLKLIRESKLSKLDLLKVFGKKKTNDLMEQVEIGKLQDKNLEEGEYINRNETIVAFEDLFVSKKLDWLRTFREGLKNKKDKIVEKFQKKLEEPEEDFIIIDDDFHIKQK